MWGWNISPTQILQDVQDSIWSLTTGSVCWPKKATWFESDCCVSTLLKKLGRNFANMTKPLVLSMKILLSIIVLVILYYPSFKKSRVKVEELFKDVIMHIYWCPGQCSSHRLYHFTAFEMSGWLRLSRDLMVGWSSWTSRCPARKKPQFPVAD